MKIFVLKEYLTFYFKLIKYSCTMLIKLSFDLPLIAINNFYLNALNSHPWISAMNGSNE